MSILKESMKSAFPRCTDDDSFDIHNIMHFLDQYLKTVMSCSLNSHLLLDHSKWYLYRYQSIHEAWQSYLQSCSVSRRSFYCSSLSQQVSVQWSLKYFVGALHAIRIFELQRKENVRLIRMPDNMEV